MKQSVTKNKAELLAAREKAGILYEIKGLNKKAVAKECGVSEQTINSWSSKDGWTETTHPAYEAAKKLYEVAGLSLESIATQLRVSETSVNTWKKKNKWLKPKWGNLVQQKARELYKQGKKQRQMSIELGISEKTISKWRHLFRWKRKHH